jgi:DNA polymerase III alpha subunit
MGVFRLETLEGSMEAVAFPQTLTQYAVHLRDEAPVLVSGTLRKAEGQYKIEVAEIFPLTDCHRQLVDKVSVHLPAARCDDDKIRGLKTIFRSHPGETSVVICIEYPTGQKVFIGTDRSFKVAAEESLVHEVNQLLGEDSCYLQVKQEPILRPRKKRWERDGGGGRGGGGG